MTFSSGTYPSGPLRLAVFDCDGTLVDSQSSILYAMFAACDYHGFARPAEEAVRRVVGLPLEVAIQRLLPHIDAPLSLVMSETYKSAFFDLRQAGGVEEPLFAGIPGVLDALDHAGWLMGVATGKSWRGLSSTLSHHGLMDRFVTHQTADRAQGKPHPEMMLNAMRDTGVEPEYTVMIGDTTYDVEMASNAGVKTIGVAWGYHETDELMDAGAMVVVHSAAELMNALFAGSEDAT
ncbi:MAG: HAD-IA family hydrolase [Rhodospirillales bacterium]|nr:HAD-IA family hydrolase [Rhodospirillales bacterium]